MLTHPAAARAKHAVQAAYTLRRVGVRRRKKPARPLCVIYGNCQAEPIRGLLASSLEFKTAYQAVPIPAVHEIGASQISRFQRVLGACSVIVAQPIKEGYRGLPLGTEQVLAVAPSTCTVIRIQALHYDALYPFQFNLLGEDRITIGAPVTVYHDLRTLCAAAKGLSAEQAVRWLGEYRPPEEALRATAQEAAERIRERESATDIPILDCIAALPRTQGPSFFTVNHPSRLVLQHIADGIHELLGIPTGDNGSHGHEPLGRYRTPIEQPVIDALGLAADPLPDWFVGGRRVTTAEVVRLHINWYRGRPDLVKTGLREYADRIAAFKLL